MSNIKKILTFNVWEKYYMLINKHLEGCSDVVDLACGNSSPLQHINSIIYKVGIDLYEPYINESKTNSYHDEYHCMDVLESHSKFGDNSFDATVALDLIEHLDKKQGYELINMMEKMSRKRVIIFTPNGFLKQGEYDGNNLQIHNSGWTVDEFQSLGFEVIGVGGLKFFRGELGRIRFRPIYFWNFLSFISDNFFRNPKSSFQLLCIKDME